MMTREEAIEYLKRADATVGRETKTKTAEAQKVAIKALEQEPRKDEVILTNKEYRELISNEYEHGYCKGYAEALEEQENTLDKIRAEILVLDDADYDYEGYYKAVTDALKVIDKYKAESEDEE